jgi:hypothetical protein
MSATQVMNSAMRVIDNCQRALTARRMAESSVPAWLMPMKKTKLAMYTPHEIRSRMPVTSRPWSSCQV